MKKILSHLPLILVIFVALAVIFSNYKPNLWYSGWDNLHGEFDLWRYTKQVLGGSWLEHQGLGAPMNLAHLAEVSRLPFLWLLKILLPDHLVRITFIFAMYLIGGVTMYFYLTRAWLSGKTGWLKNWLAALGGILYLLHILTLQQFYIAFEMFTVQFAFLPLLFLFIHRFTKPLTVATVLSFVGVQLLLAPSGHTPTNFYLAVLASLIYGFCLVLPKGFWSAFKTAFIIGFLTLIINSYWIVPNLYYTFHNARYVQESHDNKLFAPESVASIREAGTLNNFLESRHYLFEWQDYNFATKSLEPIFNDWQVHLSNPSVSALLKIVGILTVLGAVLLYWNTHLKEKRWAILSIYLGCASFIWMGLFPTGLIFELLYKSGSFTEAFRNPFTKLSIIFCFVSVILFINFFETIFLRIKLKLLGLTTVLLSVVALIFMSWPSFTGNFLSEKLRVAYPSQYKQLFSYLKQRDSELRILPLPQLNHAGWEYYDWQFLGEGNGYQGMGFYFFGVPQPVLHRDSDRWVETSDFFYHELKYALDSQNLALFKQVVGKYQVDMILIDETRVEPNRQIDFVRQHQLASEAGFEKVWQVDFLSIYEKKSVAAESKLVVPTTFTNLAVDANRVIYDRGYQDFGNYVERTDQKTNVAYPFAGLLAKEPADIEFIENETVIKQPLAFTENSKIEVTVPALNKDTILVALDYNQNILKIVFPRTKLTFGEKSVTLPHYSDQAYVIPNAETILVIFNNQVVKLKKGELKYQTLDQPQNLPLTISYAPEPENIPYQKDGAIDGSQLEIKSLGQANPSTTDLGELVFTVENVNQIVASTVFPTIALNPLQNPSINCVKPSRGSVESRVESSYVLYEADSFGVNCNGLELSDAGSWHDYLLHLTGENKRGRGIKFFINRSANILADDYIVVDGKFDSTFALHGLATPVEIIPHLNWEVRSFGKQAQSTISELKLAVMPLQQLASIKLSQGKPQTMNNGLEVKKYLFGLDGFYLLEVSCNTEPCLFGLDQSYDSAWMSWRLTGEMSDLSAYQLLPHFRLNSWANAWIMPTGQVKVIILYWPQLLSSLGVVSVLTMIVIGSISLLKLYQTRRHQLKTKVKQRLVGKKPRKKD